MTIKSTLNSERLSKLNYKSLQISSVVRSFTKGLSLRLKLTLKLVAPLACLALCFSTFAPLPTVNSLPRNSASKTAVNTDFSLAKTSNYVNKSVPPSSKKAGITDLKSNKNGNGGVDVIKTDKPSKLKDPNYRAGVPRLTNLSLEQTSNSEVSVKFSGRDFISIQTSDPSITSWTLKLISSITSNINYNISFYATSDPNTSVDAYAAPVCTPDVQDSTIENCVFTIKSDGSNLDNSTTLSTPSPQATFKALPKKSYEVILGISLSDDTNNVIELNDLSPSPFDYTPQAITPPNFNDISSLSDTRRSAINSIATIDITVGSTCAKPNQTKICYKPNDKVNRGAMAEFMKSTLGKPDTTKLNKTISDNKDSDTNIGLNAGRRAAIKWLAAEEVTSGIKKGSYKYKKTTYKCTEASFCYKPWDSVSRGAMAEFLWNLAGKPTVANKQISDGKNILTGSDYTISGNTNRTNAILWMAATGITVGSACSSPNQTKTCYKPNDKVNRGAMAEFLNNFYNMIHNPSAFPGILLVQDQAEGERFLGTTYLRSNIVNINFTADPASTIDGAICQDVSMLNDGSISACSNDDGVNITISARGGVRANTNSQYLFANMSKLASANLADQTGRNCLLDLNNIINMQGFFQDAKIVPAEFFRDGFGEKATNMSTMFTRSYFPYEFVSFNDGFGSSATDMFAMFADVTGLNQIDSFPAGFGSNAINMNNMFMNFTWPNNLNSFPAGFGSNATSMFGMFQLALIPDGFNFPDGFGVSAKDMRYMFYSANIPDGFTFPAGFGSAAKDMSNAFDSTVLRGSIDWTKTTTLQTSLNVSDIWNATSFNNHIIYVANELIQTKLLNNCETYGQGNKNNIRIRGNAANAKLRANFKPSSSQDPDFLPSPNQYLFDVVGLRRDLIETITFSATPAPVPTGNCYDVSADSSALVVACSENNGKDITISQDGGVRANENSYGLFADMPSLTAVNGLYKNVPNGTDEGADVEDALINTDKITNMDFMFYGTTLPNSLHLPAGFGSIATSMEYMFVNSVAIPTGFNFPAGFGSNATSMFAMFGDSIASSVLMTLPDGFNLPDGFGSKAFDMREMFYGVTFPSTEFILPAHFGAKATKMDVMFARAKLKADINWAAVTEFEPAVTVMGIWFNAVFDSHIIKVANTTIQSILLNGHTDPSDSWGSASIDDIVVDIV